MWPLIVHELRKWQPLVPVVLIFAEAPEILFQPLVRSFRMSIGPRMVHSGDVLAYLECLAESSGILGHKPGISIRDDLLRHTKPWVKILEQKSGDLLSADCFLARYEYCSLAAIMICDCKNCVVLLRLRQLRDEVHCHCFERQGVFWGDGDHCWFQGSCVDFVGLTGGAAFDILLDVLFYVRPPRVASCQSISICNSRVSGGGFVMKRVNYPPLKIVVSGNNDPVVLPPNQVSFD